MVKKAVIPIAGLGTRFLPLSKVVPKELFPLVNKPAIQYIIEEAQAAGIKEVVFVVRPKKKEILEYFKESSDIEKILKTRNKDKLLKELQETKNLLRNMACSFFIHERIETTIAKAKALRKLVEKILSLAKKDTLSTRRQLLKIITDKKIVKKIFEVLAPKFVERKGGYLRIIKKGPRSGDNAPLAIIELIDRTPKKPKNRKEKKTKNK